MLAGDETALRCFCARILGWSEDRAPDIEHALRSIHLIGERAVAGTSSRRGSQTTNGRSAPMLRQCSACATEPRSEFQSARGGTVRGPALSRDVCRRASLKPRREGGH